MRKASWWLLAAIVLSASAALAEDKADDGWIKLFDGKTLKGWKASEHPDNWKVDDGRIVATGERSHLFYMGDDENHPAEFENFHLKAELMTKPGANSGIYFHTHFQQEGWPETGHEAQVNNSHSDPVRTGSLYNVVKNLQAPAKDNEWFTEEVIVEGKHIVIKVNDKVIVDYVEPDKVEGGRKLTKGTFALQAHDPSSTTYYRSVAVKRLPATK